MKQVSHYAQVSFVIETLVLQPTSPSPCPPSEPLHPPMNPQPSGSRRLTRNCCVIFKKVTIQQETGWGFPDKSKISQVDLVEFLPIHEEIPITPEIELDSVSFMLVITPPN